MYTTVRGVVPTQPGGPEVSSTGGDGGSGSGSKGRGKDGQGGPDQPSTKRRVGRVVILMGLVSLFTDLSSEMVSAILPLYLMLFLGLSPLQYGVVDGLYQGVTAAVRIIGGLAADLTRRPKLIATIGYGLSAFCKLLFLPAHSFASVSFAVALDRSGKGIRTAPRDAIIAASATPGNFGLAFGVHRALDTVGAMGGPLIAAAILLALPNGYSAIFLMSFSVALIGLALLVLTVPDVRPAALFGGSGESKPWRVRAAELRARLARVGRRAPAQDACALCADGSHEHGHHDHDGHDHGAHDHDHGHDHQDQGDDELPQGRPTHVPCVGCRGACNTGLSRGPVGLRSAGRMAKELLAQGSVLRVVVVAALLSLATVGDGFIYLSLRETVGVSNTLFPLLFVGTSLVYLALAIPLGKLADKRGRSVIFVVGHLAAATSYLLLLSGLPRLLMIGLVLAMLGIYYAATDGVLSALVSPLVPAGARSTALSLVQTAVAAGRMVAAIGFGFVWSSVGQHQALAIYGFALLAMILVITPMLRKLNRPTAKGPQVAPVA